MYNLIVFIFLIGLFGFAFKFNKKIIADRLETAKQDNFLKELASLLGIHHESISPENKTNTIANIEEKISGNYRGIKMELSAFMESQTTGSYRSFSYKIKNVLFFEIKNLNSKKFTILPKEEGMQTEGTGNSLFDEKFYFSGDNILSAKFLQRCIEYGWINLQLKDNRLVFTDNFFEHALSKKNTGWKVQEIEHPIYQYNMQTNKVDVNAYKEFIDLLIDEIEKSNLN